MAENTHSNFLFSLRAVGNNFSSKSKKEHLCFHCLRVTYVNRLRRAGVPREAAMRLVNHASEMIHKIYQREKIEDVVEWCDAVKFPAPQRPIEASDLLEESAIA